MYSVCECLTGYGDYRGGDYRGGDYRGGDYRGGDYRGGLMCLRRHIVRGP